MMKTSPGKLLTTLTLVCSLLLLCAISCRSTPDSTHQDTVQGAPPSDRRARQKDPEKQGVLWYKITPNQDVLHITLRLLRPPGKLSLFLPGAWAGQDDWASRIRIKQARTPQGDRPITLQRRQGRLDIDVGDTPPWVELSYDVDLSTRKDHLDRFHPHKLEQGLDFFAYAPTLFILPSERLATSITQIPVEITTPRDAELVTTWSRVHRHASTQQPELDVHGFVVPNIHDLSDAFLFLSQHATTDARSESLDIAYDARFTGAKQDFSTFIEDVLAHYHSMLSASTPHTTALIRSPKGYASSAQRWGTGRRGGFVLELEADAQLDREAHILIAHEAFHLWNGHALIPDAKAELDTRWFKEGLTHYMALRTLFQMGHLSERELLQELAQAASRYRAAHRQSISARKLLPNYPYDRGVLLALYLDRVLHARADTSLISWLDGLMDRANEDLDWRYTSRELEDSLARHLGRDSLDFATWRQHCDDSRQIELTAFFDTMGLHWLDAEPGRKAKLIPLTQDQDTPWHTMITPL